MTTSTVYAIWGLSLVILLVVTIVVALLLGRVLATARSILGVAGDIWTHGKLVANNTIHIPLLVQTNQIAGAILGTAGQIVAGAALIEAHASECPG